MLQRTEHSSIARIFLALSVFLLLWGLLLVACRDEAEPTPTVAWPTPPGQGEVQELTFETIGRGDWADDFWPSEEPGLIVVTLENKGGLKEFPVEDVREQLLALDYSTHFVVAVFLGWFPGDRGQRVEVEQVVRRGSQVALYARVPEPGPDTLDTEISPYHVISIAQEGEWNQEIEFALYLNGEVAVTETRFIP